MSNDQVVRAYESAGKPDALQTLREFSPRRASSRSVWSASGLPALSLIPLVPVVLADAKQRSRNQEESNHGHRLTRMKENRRIRVHPCPSVVKKSSLASLK